ncbi:MAG TPA: helix-turn-helix domain-containing protein [Actinophytocola sp.]|uniref:helix-turn-helix domain-containing protein n=1 Tax=Actinophytocola sp. TaxID=1872138 RepID=UPI002DDCE0FB|nr:helix-turn-helix domain-containing protein [Actinophytocola sp.]HEV2779742.1 helix-turn-helix domain-containing protein [Actinophytocola sp.]
MTRQFGALLRQLRRRAGMTQEQLAERSGIAVRTIRRLETGEPTDPRIGTVTRLADALDLAPDERRKLLAEFGEIPSPDGIDHSGSAAAVGDPASVVDPVPGPAAHGAPSASADALAEAADQLAQAVARRWQWEEEQRRIHDPFPLPIRWRTAPTRLTDHWDNIHRMPPGATASPLNLTGELDEIANRFRLIPSGRLVVLGSGGSGKTVLTLRFVLDYLRTRTSTDPVPVIFHLGSWNPASTEFRDWLTGQLLRDYPGLLASAPGRSTLAAALVETGRILPVLDGFDEIADGLRRTALEALNRTSLPLVVTSRPDEYDQAVQETDVLTWAAGIELTPLTPTDLINYLPRTARRIARGDEPGATGTVWDPVLNELRNPGSRAGANLAAALNTPLMVGLARTVYSDTPGQNPTDLLDTTRFPTRKALEDHLLGRFVPTVYRTQPPQQPGPGRHGPFRTWDPERVQHWLGYLAQHLDRLDTRDLAWWQLGSTLRDSSRILIAVVVSTLATVFCDWLVYLPQYIIRYGVSQGLRAGLVEGLVIGPVAGLAAGLVYGLTIRYSRVTFEPFRVQIRGLGGRTRTPLRRTYTTRFAAGLLGGLVFGLGFGPAGTVIRGLLYGFPPERAVMIETTLNNMLAYGLVFGLATGLGFVLVTAMEAPMNIRFAANPTSLLTANRTTVLRQILLLVPIGTLVIAFGGRLVIDLLHGVLGLPVIWDLPDALLLGTVAGLSLACFYAFVFTAWGQWVILSRIWLPFTGRLPWTITAFLDDAYHRGILRQAGAVYQFRHARLQDHLSHTYRNHNPPTTPRTPSAIPASSPPDRPAGPNPIPATPDQT